MLLALRRWFLIDCPAFLGVPSHENQLRLTPLRGNVADFPGQRLKWVDGFYPEPDLMREIALRSDYYIPKPYYGYRTTKGFMPKGTLERIENAFGLTDIKLLETQKRSTHFYTSLSKGEQAVEFNAHIDFGRDDSYPSFSLVVYLAPNAPPRAGTGIYRHKRTGIWQEATKLDAQRASCSLRALNKQLDDDSPHRRLWELLDVCDNVYNRAVLFPSWYYHSSCLEFGSKPENGKLYQAFFMKARMRER